MTVQKLFIKNKYEGDGNNTTFPITFEWPKDHPEFIQVWVRNGAGVLAKTDNFLLKSGANDDIWNVSYPSVGEPLGRGETIVIVRELPLLQVLNLVNQGPFFAEDVEVTFDEVVMMIQQLNERLGRSFKVGVDIDGETSFDTTVPIVPGKTFRVNDAGTGFEVTEDPGQVYEKTVAEKDKAESAATSAQKAANVAEAQKNEATRQAGIATERASYTDRIIAAGFLLAEDLTVVDGKVCLVFNE